MHISKKMWIVEAIILLLLIFLSFGGNRSIVFDNTNTKVFSDCVDTQKETNTYAITNAQEGPMVGNHALSIKPGAYEVGIEYYSQTDINESIGDCRNVAGWLEINSQGNPSDIHFRTIQLVDGSNMQKDYMWITSLKQLQDVDVTVYFSGNGNLQINKIFIRELMIWRVTRIIACAFLFLIINLFYLYFRGNYKNEDKKVVGGLLLIILFSSLPIFNDFVIGGHDIEFHLSRISALSETLKSGRIWTPIDYEMVNGYGYPTPMFYGQLLLYIPCILSLLAIPIHICYQIYVLFINVGTCLISYYSWKRITDDKIIALVGSGIYTLSAYRICNVYVRAAVGEYSAMMFFPLIALAIWLIYTKKQNEISINDEFVLILGLSGILHCHVLSCEIVGIIIILTCIILLPKTFERKRLFHLFKTFFMTILINMCYLIPFLDAFTMDTKVKMNAISNIQESGVYFIQLFGMFMKHNGTSERFIYGDMPICLGFCFLIGIVSFAWCIIKKDEWNIYEAMELKAGMKVGIIAGVCVLFSLRLFPWDSIKLFNEKMAKFLCTVQFSWRYLSAATVVCTLLSVLAVKLLFVANRKKLGIQISKIMILFSCISVGLFYLQFSDESNMTVRYSSVNPQESIGNILGGEYLLFGTETQYCATRQVISTSENLVVESYEFNNGVSVLECKNLEDTDIIVEIPVFNYKNYQAYRVDTKDLLQITTGDNNRLAIHVPAQFDGTIRIQYEIPKIWYIGFVISFSTLIIVCILIWRNKRSGNHA